MVSNQKIFLIGMPGSGKSTIAKALAAAIKSSFLDLDDEIELTEGKSIKLIFEEVGEDTFRKLESRTLLKAMKAKTSFVMATGGGTPCYFDNMDNMNRIGTTIYLQTSIQTLMERTKGSAKRPLLQHNHDSVIHNLIEKRHAYYEMANYAVFTDGMSTQAIVDKILNLAGIKI